MFHEAGTMPRDRAEAGNREKLRWAEALADAQISNFDNIHPQIQIMQYQNLRRIAMDHRPARPVLTWPDSNPPNQWFWGPAGSGKSKLAREQHPLCYPKMCNKWWDHYDNEDAVLIDDFDKSHSVLGHHIKIWADRYPFIAEVKGLVQKNIRPGVIIITSQFSIDDIWEDEETRAAIRRRFKITHFAKFE